MFKKLLLSTSLLCALSVSGAAQADIVNLDWLAEGDNGAFLDETNGTEWLDLKKTLGMSIGEVEQQLGNGGLYDGFRIATQADFLSLVDSIVVQITNGSDSMTTSSGWAVNLTNSSRAVHDRARPIINIMGTTQAYSATQISSGFYKGNGDTVYKGGVNAGNRYRSNGSLVYSTTVSHSGYSSTPYTDNTSITTSGIYLVADGGATYSTQRDMTLVANNANAPTDAFAPLNLSGIGLAIMGLIGFRKRTIH